MKSFNVNKILAVVLFSIIAFSGKAFAQGGGSTVPFLRISLDARASGMGEVGTAIADDANAIYWNPGGLGFLDYFENDNEFDYYDEEEVRPFRQVALSYSPWLPQFNADLFYSYATGVFHFDNIDGTFGANFIFMNLGEFTRTAEDGRELGKFISNEFSLGFSYGTMVAEDLGVGAQLRYIQSNLTPTSAQQQDAGTGISASFDLGILWKPHDLEFLGLNLEDRLSFGMNLQNVGPKMTYISESDPLPTTLRLGTAINLFKDEFNDLKFAFDFSKLLVRRRDGGTSDPLPKSLVTGWDNPGAELAFGAEYWYADVIAFRAGYFTEPEVAGARQFYNFGAGVKYDIFKLNFSFINTIEENHPLANTMRFSLLIDWK